MAQVIKCPGLGAAVCSDNSHPTPDHIQQAANVSEQRSSTYGAARLAEKLEAPARPPERAASASPGAAS